MVDTAVPASVDDHESTDERATSGRSHRKRFTTTIVLFVVFVVLLGLSVWLYPTREVVNRPAPFALTMISARGPNVGAFDIFPLTVRPDQGYSDTSQVDVVVAPTGRDFYSVRVSWTYSPALCTNGEDLDRAAAIGCAPVAPPYATAGSEVQVSLPVGATIVRCACQRGAPGLLAERDSMVRPEVQIPDAGVFTTTTSSMPVTAVWKFEIHDTAFAWAANGLTAEASLPIVTFRNNGNVGYGNVNTTYRIPGGNDYDWNDGPDPNKLSWTEPVSSASTAVEVAGTDNSAADADTRDVLIVGILLGAAGGALVGAIQEFAHAESDEDRKNRRH
jgi:hypothetical protein